MDFQIIALNNENIINKESVACIGFFDLIHKKHDEILKKTLKLAKKYQYQAILVTFDQKIANFFKKTAIDGWNLDERLHYIQNNYDFDQLVVLHTNDMLISTNPDIFIDFLINELKVKKVCVGSDFVFGKNKLGNTTTLINKFNKNNVYLVKRDMKVSSTIIKQLICDKNWKKVSKLLKHRLIFQAKQINDDFYEISSNIAIPDGEYKIHLMNQNKKNQKITIILKNKKFNLFNQNMLKKISFFIK